MNVDPLFESLNRELTASQSRPLNPAETLLLRGIWQYQTYNQIAEEVGYSPGYLTNVVAPELLHRLSNLIGQRLTKKNCRILLEAYTIGTRRSPQRFPVVRSRSTPRSISRVRPSNHKCVTKSASQAHWCVSKHLGKWEKLRCFCACWSMPNNRDIALFT
jgi:hypothetical protein